MANNERLGEVTHYYDRIGVAVIQLSGDIRIEDELHFLGPNIDFQQTLLSIQIDHKPIEHAEKGQEVAIKVEQPVRRGVLMFRAIANE